MNEAKGIAISEIGKEYVEVTHDLKLKIWEKDGGKRLYIRYRNPVDRRRFDEVFVLLEGAPEKFTELITIRKREER